MIGLLVWDWRFGLVYVVAPMLIHNAILSLSQWTWHCYCDPDDSTNYYTGTINIVNDPNDFMNESYHLSHHMKPAMHWSQNKLHYHDNVEWYRENSATVFRDITPLRVFFFTTVVTRLDRIAKHYVDLTGQLSEAEVVALLRRRLRPVPVEPVAGSRAGASPSGM